MIATLYKIESISTGDFYFGLTTRGINTRFEEHLVSLRSNQHANLGLQWLFNNFGESDIFLVKIASYHDYDIGVRTEAKLIEVFREILPNNILNIRSGNQKPKQGRYFISKPNKIKEYLLTLTKRPELTKDPKERRDYLWLLERTDPLKRLYDAEFTNKVNNMWK